MLQFELTPKALVKDGFAARCEAALGSAVTDRSEYWAAPWSGSAQSIQGQSSLHYIQNYGAAQPAPHTGRQAVLPADDHF